MVPALIMLNLRRERIIHRIPHHTTSSLGFSLRKKLRAMIDFRSALRMSEQGR